MSVFMSTYYRFGVFLEYVCMKREGGNIFPGANKSFLEGRKAERMKAN